MPLTYKQAKEQLFGPDYVVVPGNPDHLKIRKLMADSAEPKRDLDKLTFEQQKTMPTSNPINKPPAAPQQKKVPTKEEVFASPAFQKHFITYLDRISVGSTRNRNVENQKQNSTTTVESNAEAASQ